MRKNKNRKTLKAIICTVVMLLVLSVVALPVFAEDNVGGGGSGSHRDSVDSGNVAQAIENTWTSAKTQVTAVVDNVVFPVVDMILAVLFFVKLATVYMEYRKHGQFDITAPAILFACLIFSLTAPLYIWTII